MCLIYMLSENELDFLSDGPKFGFVCRMEDLLLQYLFLKGTEFSKKGSFSPNYFKII